MTTVKTFIDIDTCNQRKHTKQCSGDVFLSRRSPDGESVYAVLADGLGSGLQANVAASLTATMALEYIMAEVDIRRAAEMIMDALPLCPERHISYSTFTMLHARSDGQVKLIEYGNPPVLQIRNGASLPIPRKKLALPRWEKREMTYSILSAQLHDRMIFCSDGVTQAGLGSYKYPFGWGIENLEKWVIDELNQKPDISCSELAPNIVEESLGHDFSLAGDDITAAVLHYRKTRILQVLTGPPFDKSRDAEFIGMINNKGTTSVICGGTTAEIAGRELKREITMDLKNSDSHVPATSRMEGVALITEGCITLSHVADLIQNGDHSLQCNGATQLRDLFLHHDRIIFLMGTGINPAHHDPKLPVELEIRRTIIRRLKKVLEENAFKEVSIELY